jgi:hypothetical protein
MQTLGEFEVDLEDDFVSTKKESIVLALKSRELLRYGSIIKESDISEIMNVSKEDLDSREWELLKFQLRETVKSEGFYITSRGRNDDLYILLPHEMPNYNEQKNKSTFRSLKQRTRALHMIDASLLSDEHQKKLEFEILRNASFEIEMSKALKQRCR